MKIVALLLSLSLLVITHEFGHYLFARLFKTRVNRFYLFFNWKFSILKAKKFDGRWHFLFFNAKAPDEWLEKEPDNTLWGIGWIPLGGYCDIAGMVDETKGTDDMASEPQPWEYRTKPAWQRLCIISGGVLVNFLSALLIYTCIFAHWGTDELPLRNARLGYDYHQILLDDGLQNGDIIYAVDGVEMESAEAISEALLLDNPKVITVMRRDGDSSRRVDVPISTSIAERMNAEKPAPLLTLRAPFVVKDFTAGSAAKKAGMLEGDSVVRVNHVDAVSYSEISPMLASLADSSVCIGFYRDGAYDSVYVDLSSDGKMGVMLMDPRQLFETVHTDYNFFQAIPVGISYGVDQLVTYVRSFKLLFVKDGVKNLGGFGTLGSLFPREWDWYQFWWITAFLAVILAFMNIIPIPGLDGGHILFTLWEMITRRKPSEKFLEVANTIGMFFLLLLLIVANGNDILRLFR